jgi:hypothetical protein
MTISAKAEGLDGDTLARALDLYRDLSLALKRTVDDLAQTTGHSHDPRGHGDLIRRHERSLRSVLEFGASVEQRWNARGGGAELDLDAARAEIRARLARFAADR